MKKLLFLLIIIAFGCGKSDPKPFEQKAFPQKWVLVQMTGGFVNSVTQGEDMSYQEFYQFEKNGTFYKERVNQEDKYTASGTYKLVKINDNDCFELTYLNGEILRQTCATGSVELLYIISGQQISGGSAACDGPALLYERVM